MASVALPEKVKQPMCCARERGFHRLWPTTADEDGSVVPLLDKEGPGVVDRWATTPCPLLRRLGLSHILGWTRGTNWGAGPLPKGEGYVHDLAPPMSSRKYA
jgi:hypothetical protein